MLLWGWFDLFGVSLQVARVLQVLVVTAIACFTFLCCRATSAKPSLGAALTIAWVVMSQGQWTQINHHWFTTLFFMIAAWASFEAVGRDGEQRSRFASIAGLAIGTAGMMTPIGGALAGIASLTVFGPWNRRWDTFFRLVGSCAVIPVSLIAWLIWHHALADAFDEVIRFSSTQYSSIQGVPFGAWLNLQNFPLVFLFPVTGALVLAFVVRNWRQTCRDRTLIAGIAFATAGLGGCFPRPDVTHIAFMVPAALPSLAYCLAFMARHAGRYVRPVALASAVLAFAAPATIYVIASRIVAAAPRLTTPRGRVALFNEPGASDLIAWLATSPKQDAYFFYPFDGLLPVLTGHRQASRYDLFTPGYTLPVQYRDACVSVMSDAQWLVIDLRWTAPAFLHEVFPAMTDPAPLETRLFEQALRAGSDPVEQFGTFEVRHRRADADPRVCNTIGE